MTGADASVTCFKPIVTQQVAVFDGRSLPKACVRVAGHEGPCRSADDDAFAITPGLAGGAEVMGTQRHGKAHATNAMRKRGSIPRTVPRGVWSGV